MLKGDPRFLSKARIRAIARNGGQYTARHRKPASQTWRTFLATITKDLVSVDFFVVLIVFFRVLFVFVISSLCPSRPLHLFATPFRRAPGRSLCNL
jgi:hypothetical protein